MSSVVIRPAEPGDLGEVARLRWHARHGFAVSPRLLQADVPPERR
ncbi:hypothetical protein [Amycolatopsis marina]|nr:hypothetical protein [Amycolatopsis marina]